LAPRSGISAGAGAGGASSVASSAGASAFVGCSGSSAGSGSSARLGFVAGLLGRDFGRRAARCVLRRCVLRRGVLRIAFAGGGRGRALDRRAGGREVRGRSVFTADAEPGAVGVLALLAAVGPAAALGLDDQEHRAGVALVDRQPGSAPDGRRQAFGHALPGVAAVLAAPEARAVAEAHGGVVAVEAVAAALVGHRVDDGRILGIDADVDAARVLVDEQHALPRGAAIERSIQAALVVRAPEPTEGGDEHPVGVAGVDRDVADLERLLEAHAGPGLAAVLRLVDAVAPAHRVARVLLAGPDPDHVRIARGHRDRADREAAFVLEQRLPARAAVVGPPHPAAGRRDEDRRGIAGREVEVRDPPAHVGRADRAPRHGGGGARRGGDLRSGEGGVALPDERCREQCARGTARERKRWVTHRSARAYGSRANGGWGGGDGGLLALQARRFRGVSSARELSRPASPEFLDPGRLPRAAETGERTGVERDRRAPWTIGDTVTSSTRGAAGKAAASGGA
jgi:hypothetical protein